MLRFSILPFALAAGLLIPDLSAQGSQTTEKATEKTTDSKKAESELTLEKLFPKKKLTGPSARSMAFSHDGKYAAWLYRTRDERRHGNDLWLFNTADGTTRRITSVSDMAEFQRNAREVLEDRKKLAKKERARRKTQAEKKAKADKKGEKVEDRKLHDEVRDDWVGEDDADREKAPRYGGISSFTWSPKDNELLFTSGGDVYQYEIGQGGIRRLTKTQNYESSVAYLPDGTGYTYMRDGSLFAVRFYNHIIEQIDPKFASGESLSSYRLSPDGKRAVFLTRKGGRMMSGNRKVKIAQYRDRFMDVREVSRHVSDDPIADSHNTIYLYEIDQGLNEEPQLYKVYTHKVSGPRDILRTPDWSPDSSRVAFGVFEQKTRHVEIMQAEFPKEEEKKPEAENEKKDAKGDENVAKGEKNENDATKKDDAEKKAKDKKAKLDHIVDAPAKVVYRFLHDGGPTTPRMLEPRFLADNRTIAFLSEQSGFRHIHALDSVYQSTRQLTHGNFEVYPMELSKDRSQLFVRATKEHPSRTDVYAVDMTNGAMKRLTNQRGQYASAAVSNDGKHVLASYVSYGSLKELVHADVGETKQTTLTDSHPKKLHDITKAMPEFFEYENRHGHTIHGMMFKPDGWKKTDKRPLLVYVYGGPLGTRKQVTDGNYHSASYFFGWYMAKKHGYVTVTIDPRGMSGYGAVFEKANFERVGKPQVEDLTDGVKHLIANYGVDPKRVGMHGWSFGGFQTQMCLYTAPETFQVGIAGAGPTEWENYNSWYSTGTIGDSRVGKTDLGKYSLLPLAKNLKGKLLLVHGMEDSNVLYQDTVRVYRELLKAGKETNVDLFLDPTGGHGLGGDVKTLNRYRKYEEYLTRTLGVYEGETAKPELAVPVEASMSSGKKTTNPLEKGNK